MNEVLLWIPKHITVKLMFMLQPEILPDLNCYREITPTFRSVRFENQSMLQDEPLKTVRDVLKMGRAEESALELENGCCFAGTRRPGTFRKELHCCSVYYTKVDDEHLGGLNQGKAVTIRSSVSFVCFLFFFYSCWLRATIDELMRVSTQYLFSPSVPMLTWNFPRSRCSSALQVDGKRPAVFSGVSAWVSFPLGRTGYKPRPAWLARRWLLFSQTLRVSFALLAAWVQCYMMML